MGTRRGARARAATLITLAATSVTSVTALSSGTVLAAPSGPPAPTSAATSGRPAPGTVGHWRVHAVGGGRYVVAWRSPTRFPLGDDRPTITAHGGPGAGPVVGTSTVARDGRTVSAPVDAARAPRAGDFDVVLSGDRLDVAGDDRARVASSAPRPLALPGTVTLPVDPGEPGPYAVTSSDYRLDPVKLAGMPEPIEMVGHVVEPATDAATGPRPLVLFLHGRHSVCYDPGDTGAEGSDWPCRPPFEEIPSQLGYDYIQQVLASQGYATVSIRANGINAQDYRLPDGGADARAELVEAHLDHWVTIAAAHQVDLDRVVLVGHSRGGEGVDRASIQVPLSAPYRIAGQVLIAPTDFGTQTAPYVPTVTLLPFCDGDVSDLEGQRFTDTARDLTTDDTSLKSSVLVMGANHNYFNTEWTPGIAQAPAWDDWGGDAEATCGRRSPDRLRPAQQRAVGTAYVAGAVHLFADGEQDVLPMFDGTRARVASTGTAEVLSHAIGGGRDVRRPSLDTSLTLPSGARTRFCVGVYDSYKVASCAANLQEVPVRPHWTESWERAPSRPFFEMSWTSAGQYGGLRLDRPLDLSARRLELRTIVDPGTGPADVRVRLTDAAGASAVLTPVGGGTLPALGSGWDTAKLWGQSLVVDPAAATGIDLSRVVAVDLVAANARGRIWVADLSAAGSALAPVPGLRVPTVDVGRVRVQEGNGRSPATARVPFRVVGDLTRPARLAVLTAGQGPHATQRFTVDLAPGQTSGSIPVTYQPNRVDDRPRVDTQVVAWATRNVMTDAYLGGVAVLDDDPTPAVHVRAVARTVEEGKPARWLVELDRPVGYPLFVGARVVRGTGPQLTVGDVPAAWVRRHLGREVDPDTPLWRYRPSVYEGLRRGRRTVELSIPTRRDGVAEGRESVTVRLRLLGHVYERAVHVAPSP